MVERFSNNNIFKHVGGSSSISVCMRAYASACVHIVQKLAPISRMPAITLTNIYLGERLGGEGITQNRTSSQVRNSHTKLFSGEPQTKP
jgi:hypothetical protein